MGKFLIILVTMGLFGSCSENKVQMDSQDSLVFGEAYGFCVGDCAHFFQIKGGSLYRDDIERYLGNKPTFDNSTLASDQFELTKDLLSDFPAYLLDNPNQTFGCPDCADQGGIYLFYNAAGEDRIWNIDTNIDNQPSEIREYVKKVREIVAQLKN